MATRDAADIQRIAVIGTGVIGAGWAARCLARGLTGQEQPTRTGVEGLGLYLNDLWY